MNMKLNRNCLMLCMVIWMGGCSLDKAPDCIPGHEMCDSDDLTGNSILYVCDQNKKWLSVQSCLQCNNNTCSNTDPSWNCDAEGELTCSDIDSVSIQFECVQHHLVPNLCNTGSKCEDNHCGTVDYGCKNEDERHCMWLEPLGMAVQTVCRNHELLTLYCGKGHGCDGNRCEVEQRAVGCIGMGVVWDDTNKTCACDTAHHWTGTIESCTCEAGYIQTDNTCVKPVSCTGDGEIRGVDNICVCDTDHHWTGSAGNCKCEANYIKSGNTCVPAVTCTGSGEVPDLSSNTCICDKNAHWTGTAGSCECESGYTKQNHECVLESGECDGVGLIKDKETNTCKCDTDNHWTGNSDECICETGYYNFQSSNKCEKVGSCLTENNLKEGDVCTFGRYYQSKEGKKEKTDLDWFVLTITPEGYLLLISRYVLEARPYNLKDDVITWEQCTLRSWLNGLDGSSNQSHVDYTNDNFMKAAFSEDELNYILKVSNTNQDSSTYDGGNDTVDSVFLLSYDEIAAFFQSASVAHAKVTAYAIKTGIVTYPAGCQGVQCSGYWWLRSPGEHMSCNAGTISGGFFGEDGGSTTYGSCIGVRPALLLRRN